MNLYECFFQNGSFLYCNFKSNNEDSFKENYLDVDNIFGDLFEVDYSEENS